MASEYKFKDRGYDDEYTIVHFKRLDSRSIHKEIKLINKEGYERDGQKVV